MTKDELEIGPIWHQWENRVLAHILVCFPAYYRGTDELNTEDSAHAAAHCP